MHNCNILFKPAYNSHSDTGLKKNCQKFCHGRKKIVKRHITKMFHNQTFFKHARPQTSGLLRQDLQHFLSFYSNFEIQSPRNRDTKSPNKLKLKSEEKNCMFRPSRHFFPHSTLSSFDKSQKRFIVEIIISLDENDSIIGLK